jgi:uncharacterized protein YecE (DUF72 family)
MIPRLRGHGPTGEYKDRYPHSTLRKWSRNINRWQRQGLAIYCYFDNDQKSAAPLDARELSALVRKTG